MDQGVLPSYERGHWAVPTAGMVPVLSALDGEIIARVGTGGVNFKAMAGYAREVGGPGLRALTFHQRALMLKALAAAILARKEELYALSAYTGATRRDGWVDIEGGTGTLSSYASKGRRELPNERFFLDGEPEMLAKSGAFMGQHIYTSRQGVAVHINAFNFPVWGMLEKLGPCLLAGMPAIVKPATASAYVAAHCFKIMIEAEILPPGALQLICGGVGDLLDHLGGQDVLSFTGSAATAQRLQAHPVMARESVRFIAERDSLNAVMLGPDAGVES
ncbi:MAG: aldehyde dehydrogenase family protein, partial [Acidocella sp.]|nr:aldehyde dehydrogenase family protein [Acidocella sp.]